MLIEQIRGGGCACDQGGPDRGTFRLPEKKTPALRFTAFHRMAALTAGVAILAACGFGGADPGETVVVRDSAGIRIVENFTAAWPEGRGWEVDETPVAAIGVLDGPSEYLLDGVVGAALLPDGRILVGNGGSQELLLYDGDGVHLKRAGGEGGGPGEFEELWWAGSFGDDSIAAFDFALRRVSVFSTDLEFVRSIPAREIASFFSLMRGFLADGSFVATAFADSDVLIPLGSGRHRPPLLHHRFSADGMLLDTLGPFPGNEVAVELGDNSIGISVDIPFGRGSHLVPAGDRFYFVDNARAEVQVLDMAGILTGLIRAPHEPRAIGRAELEAHVAHMVRRIEDAEERRRRRAELLELTHPSTMPAFEADPGAPGVLLDTRDNLWVQEYRWPRDDAPTWRVFDPDGHFLGRVRTPAGLDVRDIGEDYIVGVASDAFDVEQVRVHALRREGAEPR
jgi:hypothetical protein